MAIVKMHQSSIFVSQLMNPVQLSDDPIHGKNPISGNQFPSGPGGICLLQFCLQIREIIVLVAISPRLAETDSINN